MIGGEIAAGRGLNVTILPDANLYIDGKIRPATGGKTYDVLGPWTGEVVTKAADATAADVEEAIVAARRAFDETDWSTNHELRYGLVKKLRDLIRPTTTAWSRSPGTRPARRWARSSPPT